jgi:sulfur carrier protein
MVGDALHKADNAYALIFLEWVMTEQINVQVNGQEKICAAQTFLPELLQQLGMNPQLVAVEYNGEILPRPLWAQTEIQIDDRLEVVTIVGGG